MSGFNFKLDGLKATVLADLPKQQAKPANADQSLMGPVADFIASEIEKLDPKYNGVMVIAGGEFDRTAGRLSASIQIFGKPL